jgi:hypothetical protein
MIRSGFLSPRQRAELMALLRDAHTEQRLARRAHALLVLDDDTVRGWCKTYTQSCVATK